MARSPYDLVDDEEDSPTRPRTPRPGEVVAGTPGDPSALQSHGTEGWDPSGHSTEMPEIPGGQQPQQPRGPFEYTDPYEGMAPPQLTNIQQRPRVTVPQVGRAGSVLGSVTGAIGGFQELKQRDWDAKREAPLGDYTRRLELSKQRAGAQHGHEMAMRLTGQGAAPVPAYDKDGRQIGLWIYDPTQPGEHRFLPGAKTSGMASAETRAEASKTVAAGHDTTAITNTNTRAEAAKEIGAGHDAARVRAGAQQAARSGKTSEFIVNGQLVRIHPPDKDGVSAIERLDLGEGGIYKPGAAPRPDKTTVEQDVRDKNGNLIQKTVKTKSVPPKGKPADPMEGRTATGANGQKIIKRGGKWVDVQTGQPVQQ